MRHYEGKVGSKGQVTIPVAVREHFSLKAGDIVDFYIDEEQGSVEIVARNKPISELFGLLDNRIGRVKEFVPEHADEFIAGHLAQEDERVLREWNEWRDFQAWRRAKRDAAA
ncbi:AbrB/MazE/SpoVT family DNA-binding domain-containing protein [Afifella marina]|uniref:Looped-hinge helix DNA binding domain-containing protein, AbrB family n=2 Tax=Afifella marina TaxID=1080 RepID=A0A1G5MJ49_AFIMA|nr:AbrB/MazE/SpoVT family DNA-binding domain-containing protein [Afifella marina]MBK1623800.1 hypothetical protein [Afifella marina DSM 2698]MBK1627284.1 hypothetical protein [Afifella marina]MBK5918687.1 hypothetical protein [Afifella marina]RAI22695.1 hypothetical protein CH311_03250 [Afifella marina DSM 2698]SCZ25257.1 looped-hinge helix DNA binding domain-containing protein, AbrB family [Afifella marina DSM 2698]